MINIIPKPLKEEKRNGYFTFIEDDMLLFNPSFPITQEKCLDLLKIRLGVRGRIKMEKDESFEEEEYSIEVTEDFILLKARSEKGMYYCINTFTRLLPSFLEDEGIYPGDKVECVFISDKPRFSHRGLMVDVSRHFFPKEEIMKLMDAMAEYKLNVLHLHLSDDQGFRLDLPSFPLLKEIGSKRDRSLVEGVWKRKSTYVFDDIPVSGYYTKEDIDELLEYAEKRFIKIIPEIDMPGHMSAILASYKEYANEGRNHKVLSTWGIFESALCIGNEESLVFAQALIKETADLFKTKEIHIGGDEVPPSSFKHCKKCKDLMKKEGIKKYSELQKYFTERLTFLLAKEGYKLTIWNDAALSNLDSSIKIQVWNDVKNENVSRAIKNGSKLILSPYRKYYLDFPFTVNSMKSTYEYNPVYQEKENVVSGIEAPIWTEWVDSIKRLEFMVFPRLLAISESAWTFNENKDYDDFLSRLKEETIKLDLMGINYAKESYYTVEPKEITKLDIIKFFLFSKKHFMNEEYFKHKDDE